MKRLLCIVGGMNAGGAETFLMKMYRALDRDKYQMDFAVAVDGIYDVEIKKLGGKIFKIMPKSQGFLRNFNDIRRIVSENHYVSVLRVSQNSLSAIELLAAKLGGARIRGYRSSNSSTVSGTAKEAFVHKVCMCMPKLFANVRFAPSTEAAEYMFGKGCIKKKQAFLLKNGLDLGIYHYSLDNRNKIRSELEIEDAFVVGHIGRFNQQKNHDFLIDIFYEIKKEKENAILVLCGEGEKEGEIREKVENMGLGDSVKFLGIRADIPEILSAMDVFVFPSLYEGMPNTVIEAQALGLPCYISDRITREAKVTELVSFLPLKNPGLWKKEIIEKKYSGDRYKYNKEMERCGYSIYNCTNLFVKNMFE